MNVQLIEVGSQAHTDLIIAATKAAYEFAKTIYQGEIDSNRTISRKEAMMANYLNCKITKLQYLINAGDIQVTDTKPQHIYVKSIIKYKKRKVRK